MTPQAASKDTPEALWLSVNPSFQKLDTPLLRHLARRMRVAHWVYTQTPDEPGSLEVALTLLHDYLKGLDRPLHLVGHGTGGLLGLLYARQHPDRVKSLALLAVGVDPTIDWKAHYYEQLEQLDTSRKGVLMQTAQTLFGPQPCHTLPRWVDLLERDLLESLSIHSLLNNFNLFPAGVSMPLLVCGGQQDAIVDPTQVQGWQTWLKAGDRLWLCPDGGHFFHNTHAQRSADEIGTFWETIRARRSLQVHLNTAN